MKIAVLPGDGIGPEIVAEAVKVLNEVLEQTGAELVVSSDWRLHATLEELGEYYLSKGILTIWKN
mgnify:CR=1 FL=1